MPVPIGFAGTLRSAKTDFEDAELAEVGFDAIPRYDWHRCEASARDHHIAGAQSIAVSAQLVGDPGERAARVAQHIGAGALPGECAVAIGRDAVLRQIK